MRQTELRSPRTFPLARSLRTAGGLLLAAAALLTMVGCIIFPVPSVSPDYEKGIIEDDTLESLVGLDQEAVNERIGYPDFSGKRKDTYVLVYQGEKRYSTDVYMAVGAGYTSAVGKVDEGASTTLYCYVIELDEGRRVEDFDVEVRPKSGLTTREGSIGTIEPVDDCSEVVWGPGGQQYGG